MREANLIGKRYGSLVVLSRNKRIITCRCDCGNTVTRTTDIKYQGKRSSCGCKRGSYISEGKMIHGMSKSTEYKSWIHMRERCQNPNSKYYSHYGGRGIKVCERWSGPNNFPNFLKDMGMKPQGKHSIDRIDVNGDYTPENCRWATDLQQARNTRTNITFNGKCMKEWALENSLPYSAFAWRVKKHGWQNAFKWNNIIIDGSR